jgi:2-polyprenyl-3-methyl-5-hydroxy-6-metoxy-1,4-benzoquinol methylase
VNYTEQQQHFRGSRIWSAVLAFLTVAAAGLVWTSLYATERMASITFGLVIAALAGSLFYSPDYLHLNVNTTKRARWQIKIRWRLLAVGLIIGLLSASHTRDVIIVVAACTWFAAANLVAKSSVSPAHSAAYFWFTDCATLAALFIAPGFNLLVAAALVMAAAHLAIVACEKRVLPWTVVVMIFGFSLVLFANWREHGEWIDFLLFAGLLAIPTVATAFLVARAQRQNAKNVGIAIRELTEFTEYPEEKIRQLWATSNQQLAANWQVAQLDESDPQKMKDWYRENSELYMFAISGYNLEYKRICDSLNMLKLGRGACLDYGAGNGEIILELARRGHAAIYFDVDGTSMKFARQRAGCQNLSVEFLHSKTDLAASAQKRGLDTIFSFDVLEHLPDLPGELTFLSSLLNPGGLMAFDVPAGSTKSHPMHLNHHLNIHAHMQTIGMEEAGRGPLQKLPFRKQEKYIYRKRA